MEFEVFPEPVRMTGFLLADKVVIHPACILDHPAVLLTFTLANGTVLPPLALRVDDENELVEAVRMAAHIAVTRTAAAQS